MSTRILIVDNEPRWISFVINALETYDIVVASDMMGALKELEDDHFELVIASSRCLDILEIIQERFSNKQVIVTTIHPTTQEALDAFRKGAARYFTKSFNTQEFLNHVNEVIVSPTGSG